MSDLDRLVRRLRGLTPLAWAAQDRRATILRLAEELAEVGAEGHRLPAGLPDHAMADVIAVVGREAIANGRRDEVAAAVRRALAETR